MKDKTSTSKLVTGEVMGPFKEQEVAGRMLTGRIGSVVSWKTFNFKVQVV
jgi:hypothetical protein